ncbi:hypothetical protein AQPE_0874 [Aquipluma nitroreducens]|uniref:Uncharacterized protein n=1 Tax=Aquipluma nitroreducens TaxID=2010828 RepID=A0A5K7S596_9BACT|nr:hypothetical protein AQPE_0874 [Aquipluma nitroreducens]
MYGTGAGNVVAVISCEKSMLGATTDSSANPICLNFICFSG